ncbi:MAG: rhomboid family intramembrane serine protease [Deltaproteobacteria bacterium]|nr:rhomboid family intramembrane serine protease [Deltaproteobacteria bacterium]
MIPIRDTIVSRHYPVVTHAIIAVNVLVFFMQPHGGVAARVFTYTYGLVPARYTNELLAQQFSLFQQVAAVFSFMFLHGGFWHILGNMWCLYIFGDNVEDRLGPGRFLMFYVACGLASGICHFMSNPSSAVPVIGASGAIAGVMGAYFILYPHSRILTLIPIIFIPWFIEIPAYFFLGFWFIIQFVSASGPDAYTAGIAWWAHVGGFIFGIVALRFFGLLPDTHEKAVLSSRLERKRTERLQIIRPAMAPDSLDLYGELRLKPHEAEAGALKLVNIPWGFHPRLYRVVVPPGTVEGSVLRLKNIGRVIQDGRRGDLLLKVSIR